jgi:hypothetical protein
MEGKAAGSIDLCEHRLFPTLVEVRTRFRAGRRPELTGNSLESRRPDEP